MAQTAGMPDGSLKLTSHLWAIFATEVSMLPEFFRNIFGLSRFHRWMVP